MNYKKYLALKFFLLHPWDKKWIERKLDTSSLNSLRELCGDLESQGVRGDSTLLKSIEFQEAKKENISRACAPEEAEFWSQYLERLNAVSSKDPIRLTSLKAAIAEQL